MRIISKWVFRLRATLFPDRLEKAMQEEMNFHMEMEARKLMANGMTPKEALRKARRDFGEPEYHKEKARESWGIGLVQNFKIDAWHTLRSLRRNPGFALVAILTLGLGIGANSAIFSVVNGVLFRDLPFPEPDRLVSLCETFPDDPGRCATASTPNVADWAERSSSFQEIGAFRWWGHILETPDGAAGVSSLIATPEFFSVMGYQPAAGRLIQAQDQLEGNRHVAVLDHDFWEARFGSDPNILGTTISLSGEPFEVVGVLQKGQKPPTMSGEPNADVWLPLHFDPRANDRRNWRGFYAVGRLAADASLEVARQELEVIQQGLLEEHPVDNRDWGLELSTLHDRVVGGIRNTLFLFFGAVGLVLLITCANIANLILARFSTRETELGIRTALGAGIPRLTSQLLTEGLILALLGSALGLAIAWLGTPVFLSLAPTRIPRLEQVAINGQVLGFTLGLAVLATLLFGLAPLARASRIKPMEALRRSRHGKGRKPLGGINGVLVVSEVALALALLVGAGLLIRSFAAFNRWDPGIDQDHLLVASTSVATGTYQGEEAVIDIYRTLDEELLSLPGVVSVARASSGPLFGGFEPDQVYPGEEPGTEGMGRQVRWFDVSPSYFETMGISVLRGRAFTQEDDWFAPMVVVVNETLANQLWPGENPLGREIWLEMHEGTRQVVGVVRDIPPLDPDAQVGPEMYWPQAQYTRPVTFFILRTEVDPGSVQRQVQDRVHSVDPDIQVRAVSDYEALVGRRLVQPRFNMFLIAIFSGVALVLAGVGIYGVVSRSVAVRTREIGIRIAMGAKRSLVVRQVMGQSLGMAGIGVVLGLVLALVLSRSIRGFLHGVVPTDPLTYGSVALVLFGVAVVASLVPAITASRVDPMESLREE
jgi:putative ABC transport system permease protein